MWKLISYLEYKQNIKVLINVRISSRNQILKRFVIHSLGVFFLNYGLLTGVLDFHSRLIKFNLDILKNCTNFDLTRSQRNGYVG